MASITLTKLSGLSGRGVVSSCLPGGFPLFSATGVFGAETAREVRVKRAERVERPTQASVVAAAPAAAQAADAYVAVVAAAAAKGAGAAAVAANQLFGQQKSQLHTMWALRGLKPWMHPA
ncbi:hypothetical protein MTQ13_12390 [Streptomyces sp. XM4011]|uniref:Uncharacterized protein n=2 Tax=Streptomyces TaxID=1883 RepID=A0A1I6U2E6_9ACTN|nr:MULTISPECIES: hypothetical protein [Streptomyces]MCK1815068.1 hypothetical protein [Streptomyces sp. XM4011]SFS95447.1 hypothetical protein SAMN05444716_105198 [Streptomyces harbinensis]